MIKFNVIMDPFKEERKCSICNKPYYPNKKWLENIGNVCASCLKYQIKGAAYEQI